MFYLISVSSLLLYDHRYIPLACIIRTSQFFPNSFIKTGFVTRVSRRMPLVKQDLPTLPEHPISPSVFRGARFALWFSLQCFQIVVCVFVLFLLTIVLSVLRFLDSDCPFGIFKLFLPLQIVIYDNYMSVSILSNSC